MNSSPSSVNNPGNPSTTSSGQAVDHLASNANYGLMTLTCVVIASMIGSGVFTTSGYSLGALGSPGRVMLAWGIGAIIACCGAVSYGGLAKRLPVSGGEYSYLSRRVNPYMGFLAGWVSLTAGFSGAIAMAAITFEAYAVPNSIRPGWLPEKAVAIAAITVFGVGHAYLVKLFASLQNIIVIIKLLTLTVFLGIAGSKLSTHTWHWEPLRDDLPSPTSIPFLLEVASSVMWISLSYAGFNAAVYVASEVKNANVVVPRSMLIGTVLVTILYLALNAVFVSAAPGTEIVNKKEVAAISAKALGGSSVEFMIRVAIALGTLSSVAGMIMTGPRVFSKMADDHLFPRYFASGVKSIPRTVLLQSVIAAMLVMVSNLEALLGYLSTTLALSSAATVATLFIRSKTDSTRPSLFVSANAGLYFVSTVVIAVLMVINDYRDLAATFYTVVIGSILWVIFSGQRVAKLGA